MSEASEYQSANSKLAPLHDAIINTKYSDALSLNIVRGLINNGAHVEERDKRGKTALFFAVERKKLKVIEYLLSIGANVNCVTN